MKIEMRWRAACSTCPWEMTGAPKVTVLRVAVDHVYEHAPAARAARKEGILVSRSHFGGGYARCNPCGFDWMLGETERHYPKCELDVGLFVDRLGVEQPRGSA